MPHACHTNSASCSPTHCVHLHLHPCPVPPPTVFVSISFPAPLPTVSVSISIPALLPHPLCRLLQGLPSFCVFPSDPAEAPLSSEACSDPPPSFPSVGDLPHLSCETFQKILPLPWSSVYTFDPKLLAPEVDACWFLRNPRWGNFLWTLSLLARGGGVGVGQCLQTHFLGTVSPH